jgi:hypothetical protein
MNTGLEPPDEDQPFYPHRATISKMFFECFRDRSDTPVWYTVQRIMDMTIEYIT